MLLIVERYSNIVTNAYDSFEIIHNTYFFQFNHRNFILRWSFRFFAWTIRIWGSHHRQTSPQFDCIKILCILKLEWYYYMIIQWSNERGFLRIGRNWKANIIVLPCSSAPKQIQSFLLPFWYMVYLHVDAESLYTILTIKVGTWWPFEQVPKRNGNINQLNLQEKLNQCTYNLFHKSLLLTLISE